MAGYSVVGAGATGGAPVDPGPVWKPDRATRIMPIGDSITRGQGGEGIGGYRGPLGELLTDAGKNYRWVGWLGDVPPSGYWAVGGWRISDSAGWGDRNFLGRSGADDVTAFQPDIILMALGTNDVADGVSPTQFREYLRSYRAYLDAVHAAQPACHVFIARIVLQENQWPGTRYFNDEVEAMVDEYRAAGRPFHLVTGMEDMPPGSWHDGLHPNESGYRFMADVWARALGVGV